MGYLNNEICVFLQYLSLLPFLKLLNLLTIIPIAMAIICYFAWTRRAAFPNIKKLPRVYFFLQSRAKMSSRASPKTYFPFGFDPY